MAPSDDPAATFINLQPLSWKSARETIQKIVLNFLEEEVKFQKQRKFNYKKFYTQNVDVLIACLLSFCLIPLYIIIGDDDNLYYRSFDFIGAVLIASACVLSLVILLLRDRAARLNQFANLKSSLISYYLYQRNLLSSSSASSLSNGSIDDLLSNLPFNASRDGDVYQVYRRHDDRNKEEDAHWSQIPSLLLAEGDIIALQVGDRAPVKVEELASNHKKSFEVGDIISSSSQEYDAFPRNRSSISITNDSVYNGSSQILRFTNNMKLYRLLASPLNQMLTGQLRESVEGACSAAPIIYGKMNYVRRFLRHFGLIMFVGALLVAFGRISKPFRLSQLVGYDRDILILPLVAGIGTTPCIIVTMAVLLEVISLGRILYFIHPYALRSRGKASHETVNSCPEHRWLHYSYILEILKTRLFQTVKNNNLSSRGCMQSGCYSKFRELVFIPNSTQKFVELLGGVTALVLIDDELVCQDHSTPQQLLIPSEHGLKLLDLCPTAIDDDDIDDSCFVGSRKRTLSKESSDDSDSEKSFEKNVQNSLNLGKVRQLRRQLLQIRRRLRSRRSDDDDNSKEEPSDIGHKDENEIQFEDPHWWKFLPSLKAIGLNCILINDMNANARADDSTKNIDLPASSDMIKAQISLHRYTSRGQNKEQLRLLSHCIGFSPDHGDLSSFDIVKRINILSVNKLCERLYKSIDTHALGIEEGRTRGLINPDATSTIIFDKRTKKFQLLTIGNPEVVMNLCTDSWQGENCTLMPLNSSDRKSLNDTSHNWDLSDLDVTVFSYSPVNLKSGSTIQSLNNYVPTEVYLVDGQGKSSTKTPTTKNLDWQLVNNQIFLGMLGSAVRPRKEARYIFDKLDYIGVRFVYFSPRNMRRTKELASTMGIDVGWNCAISLRILDEGTIDPHRMPSTYADWDINAKLPHGVEEVKRHLAEVDNVPLLVSLYTDATVDNVKQMVGVFREHGDIVAALGLVHGTRNHHTFSSSDLSIGLELLYSHENKYLSHNEENFHRLNHSDLEFASLAASCRCAFSLSGTESLAMVPAIVVKGRESLDAASVSLYFFLVGSLALGFEAVFSLFSISVCLPVISLGGASIYLLFVLPVITFTIAHTDGDEDSSTRVPQKNDLNIDQKRRKHNIRFIIQTIVRASLPGVLSNIIYLIAFGQIFYGIELKGNSIESNLCLRSKHWIGALFCESARNSELAKSSASSLMFSSMVTCVVLSSLNFLHFSKSLKKNVPWKCNKVWCIVCIVLMSVLFAMPFMVTPMYVLEGLSWYFYVFYYISPFVCVILGELLKKYEDKHLVRAALLRRLQFETKLGMWSPK